MSGVFISYRRADAQDAAGRIFDRLVARFTPGAVFKDVDNIPPGVRFREHIVAAITRADAVVVLIGPDWISCRDAAGRRRLDHPEDVVRLEIETSLKLGRPTIPVCVSGARLPAAEQLPESIRELLDHNGLVVRPDPDFNHDVARLIGALEASLSPNGTLSAKEQVDRPLLESLTEMVQGWHLEIIRTAAQLIHARDDEEMKVQFLYLHTRNFLPRIVAIRRTLSDRAWAAALSERIDAFLAATTARPEVLPDRGETDRDETNRAFPYFPALGPRRDDWGGGAACLPIGMGARERRQPMIDLLNPSSVAALNAALQGVVDEVTRLLAQ